MNEGWWVNYRTHRYVELLCRHTDHEMTLRRQVNQKWLHIPPSVVKAFARFRPQLDRDEMLRYAMKRCPIMRIRGHGGVYTTVEFCSKDKRRVERAIRRWAKRFAGDSLILNVSNLATDENVRLTVSDLHRYLEGQEPNRGQAVNKRTPKVGIFFVVVDGSLLIDAVPVAQGEPYGETVGHGGHHDYWKALTPENAVEKRFKERAYDAYPRGRVVFFTKEKRFVLYADKCLTAGMLRRIAIQFGIKKPVFSGDEHYQCAKCNPDFLD